MATAIGFDLFSWTTGKEILEDGSEFSFASVNLCAVYSGDQAIPDQHLNRSLFAIGYEGDVFYVGLLYFLGFGIELNFL